MRKDEQSIIQAKKAAQFLQGVYRRQRRKSWSAIARRYGLSNKARAYMIANGKMKPNPVTDYELLNAVAWEMDPKRRPIALRRLIRRIGIPFLARRQRSRIGIYGAGGRAVSPLNGREP